MRLQPHNPIKLFTAVFLASILLSGCLSMQVDITPPPEGNIATGIVDTSTINTTTPSQVPSENSPTPTISLDTEGFQDDVIVVTVIDQSGGELLDQGLEVQLDGYDQFELVYQDEKALTPKGSLVFDNVPFQADRVFFASISYGGAIYRSDMVQAGEDTTSLQMAIQIYETTTSDENILIDRIHVLAEFPTPNQVQIVEIYIISNLGDSTYVAESPGGVTLSFPLPVGVESISFEDGFLGERYIKTVDGFGDTVSIPPGEGVYQTLVYYTLPFQEKAFEFSQKMSYPARAAVIMAPAGEFILDGENLEDMGVQEIPDGSVQVYSALSIPRGELLQFQMTKSLLTVLLHLIRLYPFPNQ